MHAILYRRDGKNRLEVSEHEPDVVENDVIGVSEIEFDADDIFTLLTERTVGDTLEPTIEEVTNSFDPWLAWYGGSDRRRHVVLYGPRGEDDRRVGFEQNEDGYEVSLEFGKATDVPNREFEPNDDTTVEVRTRSQLYAKRVFHDFCDVT